MGTVEKIVDAMLKMSNDKKELASKRFEEHSAWLSHEFSLIRELIQKKRKSSNPSIGVVSAAIKTTQAVQSKCPVATKSVTAPSSGAVIATNKGSKRKSPDIAIGSIRSSPDTKRGSVDYAELAVAAGLPSDLNKMKKEQLLSEIDSRGGVPGISMKSLKKELIIGLKSLLFRCQNDQQETISKNGVTAQDEKKEKVMIKESKQVAQIDNKDENLISKEKERRGVPMCSLANMGNEISPKGDSRSSNQDETRKGSIIADYRNQLRNATSKEATETDANIRAAAEFEARQRRHRDSKARKSTTDADTESQESKVKTSSPIKSEIQISEAMLQSPAPTTSMALTPEPSEMAMKDDSPEQSSFIEENEAVGNSPMMNADKDVEVIAIVNDSQKQMEVISSSVDLSIAKVSIAESVKTDVEQNASGTQSKKGKQHDKTSGKTIEATMNKWDRLKNSKTAAANTSTSETVVPPSTGKKARGGLFGFMKSAKLLLSGQKAKQEKKKEAEVHVKEDTNEIKQTGDGPTTIADLRAMLAAEANRVESNDESPRTSDVNASVISESVSTCAYGMMENSSESIITTVETSIVSEMTKKSIENEANKQTVEESALPSVPINENKPEQKASLISKSTASTEITSQSKAPSSVHTIQSTEPPAAPSADEYQMDDRDSDSEDSGTDDESNQKSKKQSTFPDWARGAQLKEALEKQYGLNGHAPVDPDTIFPEVQSCDLEEI